MLLECIELSLSIRVLLDTNKLQRKHVSEQNLTTRQEGLFVKSKASVDDVCVFVLKI